MYTCNRWRCVKCKHVNRRFNQRLCEKCQTPKALGESLDVLHGDWSCNACGVNNFARRAVCFRCSAPKRQNQNVVRSNNHPTVSSELIEVVEGDGNRYPAERKEIVTIICPDTPIEEYDDPCPDGGPCLDDSKLTTSVKDSLTIEHDAEKEGQSSMLSNEIDDDRHDDSLSTLAPDDFEEYVDPAEKRNENTENALDASYSPDSLGRYTFLAHDHMD